SPLQNGVRAQVMIHVPDFSEHTIDIVVEPEEEEEEPVTEETPEEDETPEPEGTPESTPGFGLVASVIGLLIWIYRTRTRN
ncbi:MAG: hypothetical protein KAT05_17895, partial [Spirochaetes bacterium]|nr:hypothetical protein [Spirochaetota bacterium]